MIKTSLCCPYFWFIAIILVTLRFRAALLGSTGIMPPHQQKISKHEHQTAQQTQHPQKPSAPF